MGTQEIRALLADARRVSEAARAVRGVPATDERVARLVEILGRLSDAAEVLLAERDAFTGRLRRTPGSADPAHPPPPPPAPSVTSPTSVVESKGA